MHRKNGDSYQWFDADWNTVVIDFSKVTKVAEEFYICNGSEAYNNWFSTETTVGFADDSLGTMASGGGWYDSAPNTYRVMYDEVNGYSYIIANFTYDVEQESDCTYTQKVTTPENGKTYGVETPVNTQIYNFIKAIENGEEKSTLANLDRIKL